MTAPTWIVAVCATVLVGCSTMDNQPAVINKQNVDRVIGRQWELKTLSLDGQKIVMDLDANMTITFGADGRATGFGSVNQYSNRYTFSEDAQLKWASRAFVTTRRAGPPELMQKERLYLEALGKVSRALVKGHELQLQSDDGATVLPFTEAGY